MLKIVCFKWKPVNFYRTYFGGEQVNILRNMVKRHLTIPHEFICITDNAEGIDPDIKIIPLWESPVKKFGGILKPNCFTRIRAFSKEMKEIIGDEFCWLDLDCVILNNIDSLFHGHATFRMWEATNPENYYNGSMVYMQAGARAEVWEKFNPETSPREAADAGFVGSDQAWISHILGKGEQTYNAMDGVYTYRYIRDRFTPDQYPQNARIVFFPGKFNPWDEVLQMHHSWIKNNYF
mgnify:CR=1 FL=1